MNPRRKFGREAANLRDVNHAILKNAYWVAERLLLDQLHEPDSSVP